ncbi:MAG: T9SS type A sorting domain-containing protein [Candidatus Eisenbacteria bacterium]
MNPARRISSCLLVLLLPATAAGLPFAGLDVDDDLLCDTLAGDMGRVFTADEVGDTVFFRPYFDTADSVAAFGCVFCVKDRGKVAFLSWEYDTPEGWTDIDIQNSNDGIRSDLRVGGRSIDVSDWIEYLYPDHLCWLVQSTDFSFENPMEGFPRPLGTFGFIVAAEGRIEWILDGANIAYLTPTFETVLFNDEDRVCGSLPPEAFPPEAPEGCAATDDRDDVVVVTWNDASALEQGFRIRRNGFLVGEVPPDVETWTDVPEIGSHRYDVRAYNWNGESEACADSGTLLPPPPPGAPYDCAATDTIIDLIVVTWTDGSDNEEGFRVWRGEYLVGTAGPDTESFDDPIGLGSHLYTVRAFNAGGESEACVDSGTSTAAPVPPPSENCAATDDRIEQVLLEWDDVSDLEVAYRIRRDGLVIQTLPEDATTYVDQCPPGTYVYGITALNSQGVESDSCSATGTAGPRPAPTPPSWCAATDEYVSRVVITWADDAVWQSGFRVYRDGEQIAQVGANAHSLSDYPSPGTYLYEVVAYNYTGESEPCADSGTRLFGHHFAGLDFDGDLDCEIETGDLGRVYAADEVGDTVAFEPFFDTPDYIFSLGCTFCVTHKDRLAFIDWDYETPSGWTNTPILTVDGPDPGDPFEVSDWIVETFPDYRCWLVTSTNFNFDGGGQFAPAPLGEFRFEVAAEGAIEWILDGPGIAYLSSQFQTVVFDDPGQLCYEGPEPPLPPDQPTGCDATEGDTVSVTIIWQDNAEDEEGFRVRRDGELLYETDENEESYVDEGVTGAHVYTVTAFGGDDESRPCEAEGSGIAAPRVWVVRPDGSGDAPTIQAAIDSVNPGDHVRLRSGIFTGPGNREIDLRGKSFELYHMLSEPGECVIDCEGTGRGFLATGGEGPETKVRGVTVRNGTAQEGGAAYLTASPTFEECRFEACAAESVGGAIAVTGGGAPSFTRCLFAGNSAVRGGAIDAAGATVALHRCTLAGCSAPGGMLFLDGFSALTAENVLIASGLAGAAVQCEAGASATFTCSDLWGNAGGDWTGCVAGQEGTNGNISLDPRFCRPASGNFKVRRGSPCVADSACGVIGAYGVGCFGNIEWEEGSVAKTVAEEDTPSLPPFFRISPNPARGGASIRFHRPESGPVAIRIYDVAGRWIREFESPQGTGTVEWDGRSGAGEPVAAGVYFLLLEDGRGTETRRLVLIR